MKKWLPLQRLTRELDTRIVLWCNGSTTDSGPVCLGSNPSRTTIFESILRCFFIVLWCNGSTTDSGPVCLGSNPSRTT